MHKPCCFGQVPGDSWHVQEPERLRMVVQKSSSFHHWLGCSLQLWERARLLICKNMVYTPFLPQLCTHGGDKADNSFTSVTFLSTLGQDPWFSSLFIKTEKMGLGIVGHCVSVCVYVCVRTHAHTYLSTDVYTHTHHGTSGESEDDLRCPSLLSILCEAGSLCCSLLPLSG